MKPRRLLPEAGFQGSAQSTVQARHGCQAKSRQSNSIVGLLSRVGWSHAVWAPSFPFCLGRTTINSAHKLNGEKFEPDITRRQAHCWTLVINLMRHRDGQAWQLTRRHRCARATLDNG
jgi:hypothetical protein